jgi:hypothetical protein
MSWSQIAYGIVLTFIVGAAIALCAQWRERPATHAARLTRLRLERRTHRPAPPRPDDRRTDRAA